MKTLLLAFALSTGTPSDSVVVQTPADSVQVITKKPKKKWHRSKKDDCRPSVMLEALKMIIPAVLSVLAVK